MTKLIARLLLISILFLSGCDSASTTDTATQEVATMIPTYTQISAETAKTMMEEQQVLIVDVREQAEFDERHIPGAVLLPVGSISEDTAAAVIGEKDEIVLVYCRSGNRSKTASQTLAELGYTNVYEFGGIIDWPYEIESAK